MPAPPPVGGERIKGGRYSVGDPPEIEKEMVGGGRSSWHRIVFVRKGTVLSFSVKGVPEKEKMEGAAFLIFSGKEGDVRRKRGESK